MYVTHTIIKICFPPTSFIKDPYGETCTSKWEFLIRFVTFTTTLVSWLIIVTPSVGWDIMGYESYNIPSYH